jgi:cytochrome c oxidase cbb3-type subunit 2
MGIGMGQHLGFVPPLFVLAAGVVILPFWSHTFIQQHKREVTLTLATLLVAFGLNRILTASDSPLLLTPIERGRQVYISEGCINCHTQYVRPDSPDVLMWGPAETLQELRQERPPLIGNRRQGPDLSQVGGRRFGSSCIFTIRPRSAAHPSCLPMLFSSATSAAMIS